EQALLVDLHPDARGCREDHVVAGLHGHLDAGLLPPVEPRPDGEDDALLGRRVVRAGRDDEPRAAHPVLVELLDYHLVEQRPKLVANGLNGPTSRSSFHGAADSPGVFTNPARSWHSEVLFGESNEGRLQQCTSACATPATSTSPGTTPDPTSRLYFPPVAGTRCSLGPMRSSRGAPATSGESFPWASSSTAGFRPRRSRLAFGTGGSTRFTARSLRWGTRRFSRKAHGWRQPRRSAWTLPLATSPPHRTGSSSSGMVATRKSRFLEGAYVDVRGSGSITPRC